MNTKTRNNLSTIEKIKSSIICLLMIGLCIYICIDAVTYTQVSSFASFVIFGTFGFALTFALVNLWTE